MDPIGLVYTYLLATLNLLVGLVHLAWVGKHKAAPIGNAIGNAIANGIGNTIGNTIANTIGNI